MWHRGGCIQPATWGGNSEPHWVLVVAAWLATMVVGHCRPLIVSRHRRRHAYCAGMDGSVLKVTPSERRAFSEAVILSTGTSISAQ